MRAAARTPRYDRPHVRMLPAALLLSMALAAPASAAGPGAKPKGASAMIDAAALEGVTEELIATHGSEQEARIRLGLRQVAQRWRPADGDVGALATFAREHFVADPAALDDTFAHLEYALEMLGGHANEVARELQSYSMLDRGPLRPIDRLLAAYSPRAHLSEDLFRDRIAFVALLNFPITTLQQRLEEGPGWSRRQWAEARLTGALEHRLPPEVAQRISKAFAAAEHYIDSYNVVMDHVVAPDGSKPFRKGLKLISHWGLRDEIRALYGQDNGLASQQIIARIMERIVRQEIPAAVIDADTLEWDPTTNRVRSPGGAWKKAERELDRRYERVLDVFHAQQAADPYFPELPTHLRRSFEREREMPEARVRELFEAVLRSPVAARAGRLMSQRLGRPLQPFDIWYTGFRGGGKLDERALDAIARKRYPTVQSFQDALPSILVKLGFSTETAAFLSERIVVDPARGAGHAYPAELRAGRSHLRTRVPADGFDYKGFNIAMHELGHNVEQVFSIARVDHTLLAGVPNNGFTEAFAFMFQAHDLEMLGQANDDPQREALGTLDRFWDMYEIAGVGLLDANIWRWMYEHPNASPAELRAATVRLATELWNEYYAPVFGVRDQILPAIYSHIVAYGLYTPNYPLGFLITYQVEQHMRGRNLATEMERMCRLGRLAPDVWMQQAVGSPVSAAPLVKGAAAALDALGAPK